MAARMHGQEPGEREKAVARVLAREVAARLEPALAEMSRKLDTISQRLDDLLGQLAQLAQSDPDALHVLLARTPTPTPRTRRPPTPTRPG
jgi:hypothetical protein